MHAGLMQAYHWYILVAYLRDTYEGTKVTFNPYELIILKKRAFFLLGHRHFQSTSEVLVGSRSVHSKLGRRAATFFARS